MIDPILIAIIALQAGDLVTTHYALGKLGGYERNKLLAGLMKRVGVLPALLLTKLPLLGGVVYAWELISLPWQWFALAVSVALVINNLVQIRKARNASRAR